MACYSIRSCLKELSVLSIIVLSISLTGVTCVNAGEPGSPRHYPGKFDGVGYLHRLAGDQVVINDQSKKLASYATFNTPESPHTSRSELHAGSFVGYLTNSKGEVISLWLIK
jgi:hypothetical protein